MAETVDALKLGWLAIAVVGMLIHMVLHHWASDDERERIRQHRNGALLIQSRSNIWTFRMLFVTHWLAAVMVIPSLLLVPRNEVDPAPAAAVVAVAIPGLLIVTQFLLIGLGLLKWDTRKRLDRYFATRQAGQAAAAQDVGRDLTRKTDAEDTP